MDNKNSQIQKIKAGRNKAILLSLSALMAIIFITTLVKFAIGRG